MQSQSKKLKKIFQFSQLLGNLFGILMIFGDQKITEVLIKRLLSELKYYVNKHGNLKVQLPL
jgi:hypothetical protein